MNNYRNLDLDDVLDKVASFASFSLSKDYIKNEEINYNPLVIKQKNQYLKEALEFVKKNQRISFDGVNDISSELDKALKGIILTPIELLNIYKHNIAAKRIKLALRIDGLDYLKDFIEPLIYDESYINEFPKIINDNLDVRDDASPKLLELTKTIIRKREEITKTANFFMNEHSDSIQEKAVYERNGRACLLIKVRDKNKFNGLLHGESSTGLASYVEPKELMSLNNDLSELEIQREEEIARLLLKLTYIVNNKGEGYAYNIENLVQLDVIMAKATFGYNFGGVAAEFSDNLSFNIKNSGNPLIDEKKLVLNSYNLYDYQGIVISGSNTGGKTVSLKTIGLAHISAYLGIPVIAESAELAIYDGIYSLIDENQSIKDSLSTYSASLKSINDLLNNATSRSLVLIDEIGNGTDPKEGEALALALIDKFLEKGIRFVLTTHFNGVKDFAYNNDKVLLSSVIFDKERMVPTYKYRESDYGFSNSLEIAKYYIDDISLIEKANSYLENNKSQIEVDLEKLAADKEHYRIKLEELNIQKEELQKEIDEYKEKVNNLNLEKDLILADVKKEMEKTIEESKEEINQLIASFKQGKIKQQDINRKFLELELNLESDDEIEDKLINVNDMVALKGSNVQGKVLEVHGDKIRVNLNGRIMDGKTSNFTKLYHVNEVKPKKKIQDRVYKSAPKQVNVIGLNTEDALLEVGIYIDKMLEARVKHGHIVHGVGQGILRTNIHNYLRNNKYVKEFKLCEQFEGGAGATNIILK